MSDNKGGKESPVVERTSSVEKLKDNGVESAKFEEKKKRRSSVRLGELLKGHVSFSALNLSKANEQTSSDSNKSSSPRSPKFSSSPTVPSLNLSTTKPKSKSFFSKTPKRGNLHVRHGASTCTTTPTSSVISPNYSTLSTSPTTTTTISPTTTHSPGITNVSAGNVPVSSLPVAAALSPSSSLASSGSKNAEKDAENLHKYFNIFTELKKGNMSLVKSVVPSQHFQISYLFWSEFDIDKGSIVKLQYPKKYPYKKNLEIAAQMLPDGTHNSIEDVTYFFLKKNENVSLQAQIADQLEEDEQIKSSLDQELFQSHVQHFETNETDDSFYYCVNVCKQKSVKGARRKARVKSLACASVSPICQSLTALDKLFQYDNLVQEEIEQKEQSKNEKDEKTDNTLESPSDKLKTFPKPERIIQYLYTHLLQLESIDLPSLTTPESIIWKYGIQNLDKTVHKISAGMLFPPEQNLNSEKTDGEKLLNSGTMKNSESKKDNSITLSVPIGLLDNEIADERVSILNLVDHFKDSIMVLFNAILFEKRVMFAGYNIPAGKVCSHVLSCAAMFPMLQGFMKSRVYPYASLDDLNFLEQKGFIVGVCNPMFKNRSEWYDVLCDLNTFKITVKDNEKEKPAQTPCQEPSNDTSQDNDGKKNADEEDLEKIDIYKITDRDQLFISKLMKQIEMARKEGRLTELQLENIVRSQFRDFLQDTMDVALNNLPLTGFILHERSQFKNQKKVKSKSSHSTTSSFIPSPRAPRNGRSNSEDFGDIQEEFTEVTVDDGSISSAIKKKLKKYSNVQKALNWKNTSSFKHLKEHLLCRKHRISNHEVIYKDVQRLRFSEKRLSESEIMAIYQRFYSSVQTYDQILEFLSFFSDGKEGIFPITVGLFHPSLVVRICCTSFLKLLECTQEGNLLINKLNLFVFLAYAQNKRYVEVNLVHH